MKRKIYFAFYAAVLFTVMVFSSCASKKSVSSGTGIEHAGKSDMLRHSREIFTKVDDNVVTSDALTSKIKFTLEMSGKDMTVAGQLEMKQDKYIRIRLTPMGLFEVAMIEFTSDYVLILDRMHKEYIKADYASVPFLQANGIDFYALQALFRNTVFVPGEKHIGRDAYRMFEMRTENGRLVASTVKGKLNYDWFIDDATGTINKTEFTYNSDNKTSRLNCYYSEFSDVAGKSFPHRMSLNFTSDMIKGFENLTLTVASKKIKTEQKGDGKLTTIPRRYARKDVSGMLKKTLEIK